VRESPMVKFNLPKIQVRNRAFIPSIDSTDSGPCPATPV
jgi:hypothetical protein